MRQKGLDDEAMLLDKLYDQVYDQSENYSYINAMLLLLILKDCGSEDAGKSEKKSKTKKQNDEVLSSKFSENQNTKMNRALLKVLLDLESEKMKNTELSSEVSTSNPIAYQVSKKPDSTMHTSLKDRLQIGGIFKNIDNQNENMSYKSESENQSNTKSLFN